MDQTRAVTSAHINGPALRTIRERTGLSCSALARAVGADVSFLARVERGEKRGINRETFERVAEVLRIDSRAILVDPFGDAVTRNVVATLEPLASHELHSARTTGTAA